jgi:hypothetical protein
MKRSLCLCLLAGTVAVTSAQDAQKKDGTAGQAPSGPASNAVGRVPSDPAKDAASPAAPAKDAAGQAPADADGDPKLTTVPGSKGLGISILGNQDAPKSLVIVPWKTSELGGAPGVSLNLDDSKQPVDRDVFSRALRYYEIRSETTHQDGAQGGGRGNAAAGSGATQSTATHGR